MVHFLVECKNRQQFTRADEKSLVHQLYRYLIGYIQTRLPRERRKRRHIIILLGICTNTYRRPFRQIDLNYHLQNQRIETGKKIHAIRCYITTPQNVSKILHNANIPAGLFPIGKNLLYFPGESNNFDPPKDIPSPWRF